MKKLRRGLFVLLALLALGFVSLWLAGPAPVTIGPYVQNVTGDSAEVCLYSEIPTGIHVQVIGKSYDMSSEDQGRAPATTHRIRLAGLRPATEYRYRVQDRDSELLIGSGTFRTPPSGAAAAFSFAAVGDSGKAPAWLRMREFGWGRARGLFPRTNQWRVGEWMAAANPDLFVHLGDLIYSHDQFPAYEAAFFRPFAAVLRRAPLVATFGNHDMHRWEHPEFFRLFQPPAGLEPKRAYRDFSHTFEYGDVRFLVLDAFWEDWQPNSAAVNWLETTLATNRLPRTIGIIHGPPFSDEANVVEDLRVQERIWPILVRHGVDLVLSGDSHNYQRFKPISGVTLVIAGTGGKSIRPVASTARLDASFDKFGFLLVKVTKDRIEGEFWSGGATPDDRFTIPR